MLAKVRAETSCRGHKIRDKSLLFSYFILIICIVIIIKLFTEQDPQVKVIEVRLKSVGHRVYKSLRCNPQFSYEPRRQDKKEKYTGTAVRRT